MSKKKDLKRSRTFFSSMTSTSSKKNRGKSLKFGMWIPLIFGILFTCKFAPTFDLQNDFLDFVVNYKVVDIRVFFSWLQESGQLYICTKSYDQNTKAVQDIFISGFFSILP